MKFSIALLALSSSVALAQTNYTTVLTDIKAIRQDLIALNKTVNAFKPGLDPTGIVALNNASNNLSNAIQKATNDSQASPAFGNKGSNKVAIALTNLEKPIFSVLNNLVAKKPKFDKALLGTISISSLILQNLKTQKNESDALGAAIKPKLSKSLQGAAPFIQANIDAHFDAAIKAYSKGSGGGLPTSLPISIPSLPTGLPA